VFLTLIINGTTTQFLLHFLRIDSISETKVIAFLTLNLFSIWPCWIFLFCNASAVPETMKLCGKGGGLGFRA